MKELLVASPLGFDPVGLKDVNGNLIVEISQGHVFYYDREDMPLTDLRLTTADSNTRDRLLRWVGQQINLPVGCGAPSWSVRGWDYHDERGPQRWAHIGDCEHSFELPVHIDDTDDSTLPDGSFLNEALGLAEVIRSMTVPQLVVL